MRRVVTLSVLGLAAVTLGGCDLKEVYPTAIPPLAGVRFINAVPDTGGAYGMDLRFVDILESNAHFRHLFRSGPVTAGGVTASGTVQYKHARAGVREFKIFLDDTLQNVATVELVSSTMTLEAGKNYTAILWGYANPTGPGRPAGAPAMQFTVFEETVAPAATDVAVRVINATPYALDAEHYPSAGAPTGDVSASWTNIAGMSASTHLTLAAPGARRFALAPTAGGSTVLYGATNATNPQALIGAAAFSTAAGSTVLDIEALPGTTVAGSAVSMIVFPPSVRGTRGAQHTTSIVSGRRIGSITDLGGGNFRISDCQVTADCTPAVTTNPGMEVAGCAPDVFGDCLVTITPSAASGLAPITVLVSTNDVGTVDTAVDLTAYLGAHNAAGNVWTYTVTGYHAGVTSVWDRRPPYVNP